MPTIKQLDIARQLGVSKSAVSLALRGMPGVSKEAKRRILAAASDLGYLRKPRTNKLTSTPSRADKTSRQQTLAFFNMFEDIGLWDRMAVTADFFNGAVGRAQQYGYKVERIDARAPGLSGNLLAKTLRSAGIRGLLVGPRWGYDSPYDFPWEQFTTVVLGDPQSTVHLHRVAHNEVHGCAIALRVLVKKGYQSIGVALPLRHLKSTGYAHALGVELFKREVAPGIKVIAWPYEKWVGTTAREWINSNGFDAIVFLDDEVGRFLDEEQTTSRAKLGLAVLDTHARTHWSGIDHGSESIGASAVDLLRSLLLGGEKSIALRPQNFLIHGVWSEKDTTPGPRPQDQGAATRSQPA